MGNLFFTRTKAALSESQDEGRFMVKTIKKSITYYSTPLSEQQILCPTKDSKTSSSLRPTSSLSPSGLPLNNSPSADISTSPLLSSTLSTSRPLLVFFAWLGAKPKDVAKYRNIYLDRGFDVLVVYSSVKHFLWPQCGLSYGLEVMKVLEEPQLTGRQLVVHATSIGGYTFTQILTHIVAGVEKHSALAQRVRGHIYDSLVAGTLEHMATGLGKTLLPRFEGLVKNLAMFYFWLFKTKTADIYESSVQVFRNNPITTPALFFFSENDALCDPDVIDDMIDLWRKRNVTVESRRWKESKHAAHMRCHPQEYRSLLERFLNSLDLRP